MDAYDELDEIPQKLMTGTLWAMVGVLGLTFVIKFPITQTVGGEVVYFRDWSAVLLGVVSLGFLPVAIREANDPFAKSLRTKRLGVIALLVIAALYCVAYGFGVFA